MTQELFIEGRSVLVDSEGFLKKLTDWDESVANGLAQAEDIQLDCSHWEVITVLRDFYQKHQVTLANRAFVNLVKRELGESKGKSIYLMTLFKGSPAKLCSKISGLPKPDNCL